MKKTDSYILLFSFLIIVGCNHKAEKRNNVIDIKTILIQIDSFIHFDKIYPNGYIKYANINDQVGEFIINNYHDKECVYNNDLTNDSAHFFALKRSLAKKSPVLFSDSLQIKNIYFISDIEKIDTSQIKQIGVFNYTNIEYWNNYAIFYLGVWCEENRNGYSVFMEKDEETFKVINVCQVWGTGPWIQNIQNK
jgi:hypothetical protein